MGLGPSVCETCMVFLDYSESKEIPWYCSHCGNTKGKGHWEYIKSLQDLIERRSDLNIKRKPVDFGNYIYRRFMMPDDSREPNDRYRSWLETNIGAQGVDWDWRISYSNIEQLQLSFKRHEDAILFELSCP